MMLSPPLPLKLAGIDWKGDDGCSAGGEGWSEDSGSSSDGEGDWDEIDRLSDRDGGWGFVGLFRFKLANLEDGGIGKTGIGLLGLGELHTRLGCPSVRLSMGLSVGIGAAGRGVTATGNVDKGIFSRFLQGFCRVAGGWGEFSWRM